MERFDFKHINRYIFMILLIMLILLCFSYIYLSMFYNINYDKVIQPVNLNSLSVDIVIEDKVYSTTYQELGYEVLPENTNTSTFNSGKYQNYLKVYGEFFNKTGILKKIYLFLNSDILIKTEIPKYIIYRPNSQQKQYFYDILNIEVGSEEQVSFDWDSFDNTTQNGEQLSPITFIPGTNSKSFELDLPDVLEIDGLPDRFIAKLKSDVKYFNKQPIILGKSRTRYTGDDGLNRNINMKNAVGKINGTKLIPNQVYSQYNTISPFTEEEGYLPAGVIKGDEFTNALGGGVCQVTTTLYNAVLRAELDIIERHNHSSKINYVAPGFDATVAGPYIDFKFKNMLNTPIYVFMRMENGYINCVIVGDEYRQPSRKIEFNSYQDDEGVWHLIKTITDTEKNISSDLEMGISIYK